MDEAARIREELLAVIGRMHDFGLYIPEPDNAQFLKDNASKDEFLNGWQVALLVIIVFWDEGRWPDDNSAHNRRTA